MSEPKRHHYLPQVYLENFCQNGGLWLYNDINKDIVNLTTLNTAVIKQFYTTDNEDGSKNNELEKRLSVIEGVAGIIIKKLINKKGITSEDKGKFALFTALMQHRTPAALKHLHSAMDPILEWYKKRLLSTKVFDKLIQESEEKYGLSKEFQMDLLNDSELTLTKAGEWRFLINTAIGIAKIYSQMKWEFLYTDKSSFITSDNPLIYYEPKIDTGPYGYGIATPTVEKFIPITSNIILKIGDLGNEISYKLLNDKKIIRYINASIFVRRNQFVIAKNREHLEFLLERTKNFKRTEKIKFN